ncbi:hypothetical protein DXG01_007013 [Tephrocybe rancida]|nr:hypothetical protein DXG01_007013 [Tephrocybe rancida]
MDYSTWQSDLKCICGRLSLSPAALKYHQNSRPEVNEDLTDVLARYQATKLRVTAAANDSAQEVGSMSDSVLMILSELTRAMLYRGNVEVDEQIDRMDVDVGSSTLRRHPEEHAEPPAKRLRILSKILRDPDYIMHDRTLRDILPQPLAPLPPIALIVDLLPSQPAMPTAPINAVIPGPPMDSAANTLKSFSPSDVQDVNWANINARLGLNNWDNLLKEEWEDEDAGWQASSVSIQVPFHQFTNNPGVQDFVVKSFYHQSLAAVIREKLTLKQRDMRQFHIDPYKLYWQHSKD